MSFRSPCVLGIDLGTSSLKCVVMDERGQQRASSKQPYPTNAPFSGWAEQNPADWLNALGVAISDLRAQAPLLIDSLVGISLCSAAHIPVLLNENLDVIRPAILWSDQRSEPIVAELNLHHAEMLRDISLNEANCTWTLPQLLWIRRSEPEAFGKIRHLLSSKDFLIHHLTGAFSMDFASAAATLMFDCPANQWSTALVTLSGLRPSALPELVSPLSRVGTISALAAQTYGLPKDIPVIAGTLDSAAELIGCGVLSTEDMGMVRAGSAGGIMAMTNQPSFHRGVITYPYVIDGLYYKQAGTNSCATSLQWIRNLGQEASGGAPPPITYEQLDIIAAKEQAGSDGLIFHPFLQGERAPYWNPNLKGCFTGISKLHGWPAFVRAVMEGVGFSLQDCFKSFKQHGLCMKSAVLAGGVAKSNLWAQIIADILSLELHTVRNGDSAWGACVMAAVGIGMFPSLADAARICIHSDRVWIPDETNRGIYQKHFERYLEVAQFLNSCTEKL